VRSWANRNRVAVVVAIAVALIAIAVTMVMTIRPEPAEVPPPLPPAISAPQASTPATPTSLVISVVGKVANPGLVTLTNGARVADALRAAGGALPGTDDTALNLARRLTDGEQIYVGVPVPTNAGVDAAQSTDTPPPATGKKGGKAVNPTAKVNLNTATADELQTLPGIGPAMAQRILTWRAQHGHFDSINQLREVGGIGDTRFAKLENLVTT